MLELVQIRSAESRVEDFVNIRENDKVCRLLKDLHRLIELCAYRIINYALKVYLEQE